MAPHVLCDIDCDSTSKPTPDAGDEIVDKAMTLPPISNSQALAGPSFIGHSANTAPLSPKFQFEPQTSGMHQDGGNSGSTDYPGPMGHNISVFSALIPLRTFFWDRHGHMTAGFTDASGNATSPIYGLAAVDQRTLEIEATWLPPSKGQVLNFAYTELVQEDNSILVTSKQGQIYVVQRSCADEQPTFNLTRTINLTVEAVLQQGETLLNAMYDAEGNIWFTSGGIRAQGAGLPGDPAQASTTVGYIEPDGTVHNLQITNQMIENGIAVSGTTMYAVTGPSGSNDHANATGYMYSFKPGPRDQVTTAWRVPYSAGNARKPGAFARGSGSTPTLLGNQFVAITDNANSQINLITYRQDAAPDQTVCSVPLFQPGASNNDVGAVAHLDGDKYGLALFNNYNGPSLYPGKGDLNGAFNNMSVITAATVRVDVAADGTECKLAWDTPIRIKSVALQSTATGLLYGYTQSERLAREGLYEWYVTALDWRSGDVVWQVRAGAGGSFNDDYLPGTLGPDGTFYQAVLEGVVQVKDGSTGPRWQNHSSEQ
ncbi:MAG: hypothetical protein M1818_006317 [Claussenomyces sp. TS43310]|nr:MAG: hypothetical protein M1818_006317 [Claussenomyces sp. TS43310]